MKVNHALLLLSIAILVGPIGVGLFVYRENLIALVIPENLKIETPEIEYLNYEKNDVALFLKFKITNPYKIDLDLRSIYAEFFCSFHDTFLGSINITPYINFPANSSKIIDLPLNLTSEGIKHICEEEEIYIDVRGLVLNVNGIKVNYKREIRNIGPISITP